MGGCLSGLTKVALNPCAFIALIFFIVFDLAMLSIGITHMDKCPIQPNIPLYLVVAGSVGFTAKVLHITNHQMQIWFVDIINAIIYLFEICWIIAGSYWVYSIYEPSFNPDEGKYCDKQTYLLSFWLVAINWITFFLSFISYCCYCCPNFIGKWFDWRAI